jgi:hypothetical protein
LHDDIDTSVGGRQEVSEEKHTPGPWVAIPSKFRWHGSEPLFEDGLWSILPESNYERLPICTVDHADDHDTATRAGAKHDALLIAAAPDLLAALKQASECVRKLLNGDMNPPEMDPEGWHMAINKAEGRS